MYGQRDDLVHTRRAVKARPGGTAGRTGKRGREQAKEKDGEGGRGEGEGDGGPDAGCPPVSTSLALIRRTAGGGAKRGGLGGGGREEELEGGVQVVVTSYTMAGRLRRSLMRPNGGWGMVIADEAHVLRTTRRMRECVEVSGCGPHVKWQCRHGGLQCYLLR